MKWLHFVAVLVLFGVVWCEDTKNEESSEEDVREARQFNQEGWRIAETFRKGDADWIPRGEPLDLKLKRRRLRKRKRKPQPTEEFSDDGEAYIRRFHPQRLDPVQESWEELNEEAMRNPTIRRRITPVYYKPNQTGQEEKISNLPTKSRTEPMSLSSSIMVDDEKPQRKTDPEKSYLAGLKSLLKKSAGNISLSEILQQKNLSLSELLQGGEEAISALTEKPVAVTSPTKTVYVTETEPSTKYKRLPPSVALTKTTDRNFFVNDQSFEMLTDQETVEAQKKRFALLHSTENKLFSSVTRMEVVTEPTTERRIFVSSHPNYASSAKLKTTFPYEYSTRSTLSTTTTVTTTSMPAISPKINIVEAPEEVKTNKVYVNREKINLPTTNAKLRLTTKKVNTDKQENSHPFDFRFPEPMKISIEEILGLGNNRVKEEINDGPMKVSIDLEEFIEENKTNVKTPLIEEQTTESVTENQTYVTARKEIMEVMRDPVSGHNLSRILENRNMTLNELVEQRERGSSQRHLADIFHNSTREPEPKEELFVGHVIAESFQNYPPLNRQAKSHTFEEEIPRKSSPPAKITESPEPVTSKPETTSTTAMNEIKTDLNAPDPQPFPWKQLYPDLFADSVKEDANFIDNDSERAMPNLEKFDSSLSLSSKEQLEPDEYDLFFQIPPGVKSALFVSLAIIGLSLVVFLTLLVVFKWLQKKNNAINYCGSLSSKMKSPIIFQGHTSNVLRNFMDDTVRKKKNYFKSNMQSMSDEIWEGSRERKPSF